MAVIIWCLLSLTLAGLVVFSNQLEFLVPAVAAFLVMLLALIPGLNDNYFVQAAAWLALSAVGFLFFLKKLRQLKMPRGGPVEESVRGKTATVIEALGDGVPGRVRFQGTTWAALSAEAVPEGAEVEILEQQGLVLHVQQRREDKIELEFRALEAQTREKKE